jgi:hypothetical protein
MNEDGVIQQTKPSFFSQKKNKYIVGGIIIFLIICAVLVFAFTRQDKVANNQQNTNQNNNQNTNDQSAFMPANTCPDKVILDNGAKAEYQGKTYLLKGEDIDWIDKNCDSVTNSNSQNQSFGQQFSGGQCSGTGSVNYTQPILALNDVGEITPLGRMFDSHVTPTDHQYWQPASRTTNWAAYPVYSPADGYLVGIGRTNPGKLGTTDITAVIEDLEYRFVIEHSCDFYTIFIHIHNLAPEIASQFTFSNETNAPTTQIRIPIKAGQKIGTVGGNYFDVTTVDVTKKLTGFVNPDAYKGEPWKVYTNDTIAYYTEPLKSQYYAKVSRSVEPVGGKIDYDIDGKLVGNWFRQGSGGYSSGGGNGRYWDGHLSFAYSANVPNVVMISTGHFLGDVSAQLIVDKNTPDPATVDVSSGIVKYTLFEYNYIDPRGQSQTPRVAKNLQLEKKGAAKGTMLVQVLDNKTIKVEVIAGISSRMTFSEKAEMYER